MQFWRIARQLHAQFLQLLGDTVGFAVRVVVSHRGLLALQVAAACVSWVWLLENALAQAVS